MAGGSDNIQRLTWTNSDGSFSYWRATASGQTLINNFAPNPGWNPDLLATGGNNVPRLLWNNTNGTMSLWNLTESSGTYTYLNYGPYPGWKPAALSIGGNNIPRVMWDKTDGTMSLWTNADVSSAGPSFGPYTGYTASFLAVGPNNIPRVLWSTTSGVISLWANADTYTTSPAYSNYGPFTGYTAMAMAVDGTNAPRILWNNPSGSLVSLWKVAPDATYTYQNYSYPAGFTPKAISAGSAGSVSILWTKSDGTVQISVINSSGTVQSTTTYPGTLSLTLAPTSVIGGASSTGTVTLNSPALAGGTSVALVSTNTTAATVPATVIVPAGATSANFTVTTLSQSGTATTTITATCNGMSQSVLLTVLPPAPPAAPTSLAATGGNAQVALAWTAPAGTITSYTVGRSTVSGGPYLPLTPASPITTPSYVDTTALNRTTYYYVVAATGAGGTGPNSNEASATPRAANDATPVSVTLAGGGALPSSVTVGQQFQVSVTMKNVGSNPWPVSASSPLSGYYLGGVNPPATTSSPGTVVTTWISPYWLATPAITSTNGLVTYTFTATAPSTPNTYLFQWQMFFAGSPLFGDATAPVNIAVNAAPSFSLSASPSSLSLAQGTSQATTISLTNTGGFNGSVALTATGLPAGVTPTFSPSPISGTATSTLTLTALPTATIGGPVTVTITGTSGTTTKTTTVSLTVTANPILTSITVTPATANLNFNGSKTFTATAYDQNGMSLSPQPAISWLVTSGGGTINAASGVYMAGATAGNVTVQAKSGTVVGTAAVTVTNAAPTVATAAAATPNPVTATTTALSVLGADDGGEANLAYTWSSTGPAAVAFSVNGTNGSKNTTASFTKAGNYTLQVTISDTGVLSVTSSIGVTVNQTLTSISLTPSPAPVYIGTTQLFSAVAKDQFNLPLSTQPTFSWSVVSGGVGSIDQTGLYTAGSVAGTATVHAVSGSITGSSLVTVTAAPDFSLAASPATLSIAQSSSVTNAISLTNLNGFSGSVTLSQPSGLPSGVTANLAPTAISGTATSTLTLTASSTAATGPATLTITGVSGSLSHQVLLNLTVTSVSLSSLMLSPNPVFGGNACTGTVTLTAPAPTGGASIALTSANTAAATVPATVIVPAGATTATFAVTTLPQSGQVSSSITAAFSGVSKPVTLTVAPPALSGVSLSPASVTGGNPAIATVTLTGNAPTGGIVVALTSSLPAAATVPSSLTIPAGAKTATFTVTTYPVASATSPTITATYNSVPQTATLTDMPPVAFAISLFPATILSNGTATGTVTLTGKAPTGGIVVTLTSGNTTIATAPASITIAAGMTTGTFTAQGKAVASQMTAQISAVAGATVLAPLTVTVPGSAYTDGPEPGWAMDAMPTVDGSGSDGAGPAASMGVDLASGVEQNAPGPDLSAFNPIGPGASYERLYRSKAAALGYASPGLSPGWTDNYDLYVIPGSGTYTLHYNNGSSEVWTVTTGGGLATPNGAPYLAQAVSSTILTMTFKDRSVYTFTQCNTASANGNYPAGAYLLTKISNLVGHSVVINRDVAANNYRLVSLQNDAATPATLLSFGYDGSGHLLTLQDLASSNASEHRQVSYTFGLASDPGLTQPVLTAVSQVSTIPGTANALWKYDYQAMSGMPFLTSVSTPDPSDPTGTTYTSALASYAAGGQVQAHIDVAQANVPDPSGKQQLFNYRAGATDVAFLNGDKSLALTYTEKLNANNTSAGFTDAASHSAATSYFPANSLPGQYLPHVVTNRNNQQVDVEYDSTTQNVNYPNTYGNVQSVTDPRGTSVNYTYQYPTDFLLGQMASSQEKNVDINTMAVTLKQPTTMDYYGTGDGVFNGLLKDTISPQPGFINGSATVTTTLGYTSLGDLLTVTTAPTTLTVMLNNAATKRTTTYTYGSVLDSAIGYSYTVPQGEAVGEPTSVTVAGVGTTDATVSYYQYDGRGNTTAVIDGVGNQTNFFYNAADQLLQVLYPATNPLTPLARASLVYNYEYLDGPVSSVTLYDESGHVFRQTNYTYGKGGETLSVSDLDGLVSAATYDGCYRVATVLDGNQNATSYSYDPVGRLSQVKYPNPGNATNPYDTLTYSYDSDDNLLKRIDGNNVETDYTRDITVDSRLQSITYPAAANSNVYYGYDSLERMNSVAIGPVGSPNVTKSYTFDDLDAMLTQTTSFAGGPQSQVFTYSYYPDGSRQQLQTPQGKYGYQYDGLGRLTQATFPWADGFVSHGYQRNGWLKRTQGPRTQTDYTYNARGFLIGLRNSSVQDRLLVSNFSQMTYDAAGNRLGYVSQIPAQDDAQNNGPDASFNQSYSYDGRDELIADHTFSYLYFGIDPYNAEHQYSFLYDLAQNPTSFRSSATGYNADNQFSGSLFAYDGNGNPTKYQSSSVNSAFDPENRLLSISNPAFGTLTATYDGDGLRASKSISGKTTYFLYDGDTPLLEESQTGAVTAANGPAADGWRSRFYPGSLKFGTSQTEYGMQSYEYLYDPQGNLVQRQAHNNQAADVLDTVLYDAYGNPSNDLDVGTGTAEVYKDPVGFGGQHGYYRDTETGLSLLTNRYYDSGLGRFLTRDPIGYKGGVNLYGFCGNNPVNMMDPFGTTDDWLDNAANFSYGAGGIISGGFTDWVDRKIGVDSGINRHSTAFHAGQITGVGYIAVSTVVSGVGVVNAVRAYRAARVAGTIAPVLAQVVSNGIRGRAFEAGAIRALGATKNTATLTGRTLAGIAKTTIPDVVQAGHITEIKDVAQLSYSAQLQAQISIATARGIPYNLIVGLSTRISAPLLNAVRATGGSITRFDAATGVFRPFP